MTGPHARSSRVGHGFDLHRLEPLPPEGVGRPLILAGVHFDHPVGPVAHSDGDGVYHAVTDAILGALARPDIGTLFPDSDPDLDGADSARFIDAAAQMMRDDGYAIGNVDVTVVCERPRIGPRVDAMRASLAARLGCDAGRVNVKGRTHEQVDAIGAGKAMAVHAVVLLEPAG